MTYRVEYLRYRLPFRVPIRTAHGAWTEREGLLVRVEGPGGEVGFGEAAPIKDFGRETVAKDAAVAAALGERIDASRLAEIAPECGALRHALETALAEARGESPVARTETLALAALLPAGVAAVAAIRLRSEAGFRTFKWKVGVADAADEIALLDDVCAVLPNGGKLRLDANGAWDRRRAERWLERCAERPVEFVEQPVAADSAGSGDLLLGLAADYPTALALDESLVGAEDVQVWLDAGWPGIYVIKPSLLGDAASVVARLAAAQAQVVFSSALETLVGARSALRLAFAWPGEKRALGFGIWPLFQDPLFNGPADVPFIRREDIERIDPIRLWNALS